MITPSDVRAYQKQLQALADRFSGDVTELQAEAGQLGLSQAVPDLSMAPDRTGDQDAVSTEEEVDLALLEHEEALLTECQAALARIEAGMFGRCEDCRRPIPKRRLRAYSWARYCLPCANLHEHEGVV